ncbi:MAG: sigma-70 family RNA polymerase sigma factor [Candidatus Rokubacteria bacterium]|nr:sigma-70 family RNA polymerase sigma factor [Candidatus Rokubacteria bacterium]
MHPAHPVPDGPELIARMARGESEAFGSFYDAYAGLALGLIRRILRDPGAAEDVLQEVFLQIWREAPEYDPRRGSPEAWLVMRAKARAIDRLRSVRRREKTFVPGADEALGRQADPGAQSPAAAAEAQGLVQGALGRLPAAQRRVIELAFFGGLTQSEISAELGEPLGTIKTRARLGLERLRGLLREEGRGQA